MNVPLGDVPAWVDLDVADTFVAARCRRCGITAFFYWTVFHKDASALEREVRTHVECLREVPSV